jgi:hypothetical protein
MQVSPPNLEVWIVSGFQEVFSDCLKCKTNTIPILMHQMRISTNQVSSVMLRSKKLEIRKNVKIMKDPIKTKQSSMKLSQIRRRIELCMREIILIWDQTLLIIVKLSGHLWFCCVFSPAVLYQVRIFVCQEMKELGMKNPQHSLKSYHVSSHSLVELLSCQHSLQFWTQQVSFNPCFQ